MQSLDERHLTSPPRPGGAFYFFDPIKQTFRYPTPSKPLKVILDQLYLYVIIAVYSARSSCPRPMLTCQAVLLTPPNFCHPRPLLSRQQSIGISPLSATLMDLPASVANKRLTARLNPLDATLTKNTGAHPSSQKPFYLLALPPQTFRRSNLFWLSPFFLFIHLQMPGGYGVTLPQTTNGFIPLYSTAQTTPPFFVYTVPVLSSPLCVRGIAPFLLRWRSS